MNPRLHRQTAVLFIKNLSADVKYAFKAWCARRGRTMSSVIEEMMREKIKKEQ